MAVHMATATCQVRNNQTLWSAAASLWSAGVSRWREARAIAEAEDALAAMDDRMLKDIGIARDDIHRVVRRAQP